MLLAPRVNVGYMVAPRKRGRGAVYKKLLRSLDFGGRVLRGLTPASKPRRLSAPISGGLA